MSLNVFFLLQAFVMVLSAYETTANALAFTIYLLSKPENKDKLAKLSAEIDAFGRDQVPSFEELDKFPWLEVILSSILCTAFNIAEQQESWIIEHCLHAKHSLDRGPCQADYRYMEQERARVLIRKAAWLQTGVILCMCVQACIREAMRVFPPVPTLTREAERDMDLGGYKIEKGQMLGVAVFSMHNNPAYWNVCFKLGLASQYA